MIQQWFIKANSANQAKEKTEIKLNELLHWIKTNGLHLTQIGKGYVKDGAKKLE